MKHWQNVFERWEKFIQTFFLLKNDGEGAAGLGINFTGFKVKSFNNVLKAKLKQICGEPSLLLLLFKPTIFILSRGWWYV